MSLIYRSALGLILCVMFSSASRADAILSIPQETLLAGNLTGTAQIQIASNNPNEPFGAFDLRLQVSAFTGNLNGQQVTINSIIPNPVFGSYFGGPGNPPPPAPNQSLSSGGTIALFGIGTGFNITATPQTLFTVSFSVPTALTLPSDTFTLSVIQGASPLGGDPRNSIVNTNNQGIFSSGGLQLVAVPEPSTLLMFPLLGASALFRRRRVG